MTKSHHHFADFLLLIIALIIFLVILVASPVGTKTLAYIANHAGLGLDISGVRGTVMDGLVIKSFQWKGKKAQIELVDLKLNFYEKPFQKDRFRIKRLTARDLNIYVNVSANKTRKTYNVDIPDIPIPLDLEADLVRVDRLQVIPRNVQQGTVENRFLFRLYTAEVKDVTIIDNQLKAKSVSAKPRVAGYNMGVWLNDVELNFSKPHQIKGAGRLDYAHVVTGQFEGPITVGGTLTNYTAEGRIHWRERFLGNSEIHIKGYGDYDTANITAARLENQSGDLEISGELSWLNKFSWQAEVNGEDVNTSRWNPEWALNADIELLTSGSYEYREDLWQLDMDVKSLEGELSDYPLQSSGLIRLKDHVLSVSGLNMKSGNNRIKLDGRITDPFKLEWDSNIQQLEQILPGYSGSVVGKGVARGTIMEPRGSGQIQVRNLVSEDSAIEFADIELQAGSSDNLLAGKIKAKIRNLRHQDIQVASADLDFDGREQASILRGRGTLQLNQLKSGLIDVAKANLRFNGSDQALDIDGTAEQLRVAGQRISHAEIKGKGLPQNHQISLKASSTQGNIETRFNGGWREDQWRGSVSSLDVKKTVSGDWKLKKPVDVTVSKEAFSGSEICINNPKRGSLCSNIQWSAENGLYSKGNLIQLLLAQAKPWLPDYINLKGVVNGNYDIQYRDQKWLGTAKFQLPDDEIEITTETGKKELLPYKNGVITMAFKGERIEVNVQLELLRRAKLLADTTIILDPGNGHHRVEGETRFDVATLDWIQDLLPDIALPKGEISSVIRYSGPLTSPGYSGEIMLKNGSFDIPDVGTRIDKINLLVKTARPNEAKISGSLYIGNSKLEANGSMLIKKLNDWAAELSLRGDRLRFINTHEVQATASPDLLFKINPSSVGITGLFHIPSAHIKLAELPETAIYESDDVVFVGSNHKTEKQKPLRILPNVKITLGNDISFEGFGLKTKLKGNFHVTNNRNAIVSRGTLQVVEGQYRAYGQRLDIEHGVLVFNGPIGNPGLDIRATRTVEDIKVGLNLAGTLQEPESTVFSDPPQPESDALSYLLTGQSLSETSGDQAQLLVQAVRTLGISSGSSLLNRVGGSVGLDDINIITYSDYKQNKIQLGKRLGPKLYVRYITGLFDTFHKIAVDYKIGSKWSLQAESGEDQGLDLIYEIDR